jgi:P4 family phage/plasmid primase-like protien
MACRNKNPAGMRHIPTGLNPKGLTNMQRNHRRFPDRGQVASLGFQVGCENGNGLACENGDGVRLETVSPKPSGQALKTAIGLARRGFWAIPIYRPGIERKGKEPTKGKEPIGYEWGVERRDEATLRQMFDRYPGSGIGIGFGPNRAPGGGWLIDLEGDGEHAAESLRTLLGGEEPDTPSWASTRGNHVIFVADGERLLSLLKAAGAKEGNQERIGVWHLPELPDLEIRVGGYKTGKVVKQVQSVCPPTRGTDGKPRTWTVSPRTPVAKLPEAVYAFLESIGREKAAQAQAAPRKGKGKPAGGSKTKSSQPMTKAEYGQDELRKEIAQLSSKLHPHRHADLLRCTTSLAGLVKAQALSEHDAQRGLHLAASSNGMTDEGRLAEVDEAWRSALQLATPRTMPRYVVDPATNGQARGSSAAPPSASDDALHLTETGNALRLIKAHGKNLRYSKPLNQWFEWDGTRWCPDQTGAIWRLAKDTVRQIGHEAANTADDARRQATLRWALKSEERKVTAAMIELAWSEPGIAILPEKLDADPWLLNTPSGTVNLSTGKLRKHQQDDLITKLTRVPFDPQAECPRWKQVLSEIFKSDPEMVAYVQRALGYSLTGVIGEHALFLCHGTGRNGKNTVLDTVLTILGDYATTANPRTFMAIGQNDHLAMLADLMGRRFVPTDEVEEGQQLAEAMVKRVTGNKMLKARFMHKNPFEFPAQFKIWMLANCKPEIHGQDEGVWSRIRNIPFEVYFPPEKRIKGLSDILVDEEGPGILRWLIEGCMEWQRIGLCEPKKVIDATKAYRDEQDAIGSFIGQYCDSFLDDETQRTQNKEKVSALYACYVEWCKESGEKTVLTSRRFGSKLKERGYELHESNGIRYRLGIRLRGVYEGSYDRSDDDGGRG